MNKLIENFPNQLLEGLAIANSFHPNRPNSPFKNVIISGLGGSGIGGDLTASLIRNLCTIPVIVNKSYGMPAFCSESSLVIVSSYSGNTEETIAAMNIALEKGATVICISSGGKVAEIAKEKNLDIVLIPGGMPPRACLGYSFVQQLNIFAKLGLTDNSIIDSIASSAQFLIESSDDIQSIAEALAATLVNKIPVIYCEDSLEPLAIRFRQQLNENAKMLCWHHVIPEMNHNELVGWMEKNDNLAVIFMHHTAELKKNSDRIEFTRTVVNQYTSTVIELNPEGENHFQEIFYYIHLFDWISYYIADLKGIDPIEVDIITKLKNSLGEN